MELQTCILERKAAETEQTARLALLVGNDILILNGHKPTFWKRIAPSLHKSIELQEIATCILEAVGIIVVGIAGAEQLPKIAQAGVHSVTPDT